MQNVYYIIDLISFGSMMSVNNQPTFREVFLVVCTSLKTLTTLTVNLKITVHRTSFHKMAQPRKHVLNGGPVSICFQHLGYSSRHLDVARIKMF